MNEVAIRSGWEMTPKDGEQAMKMAQWIAESGLVPDSFKGKPKDICVAAAMGSKLGLDVFSSMQGIAVVNGRPSLWGDVLRGLIVGRADLTDIIEEYEGTGDSLTAVCVMTRGKRSPYRATFSVADAKEAGLWGKNVWLKFSKDMLLNRAFSRAARRCYADVLSGVSVAEEMIDAEIVKDVEANVHDDKPPFKEEPEATPKKPKKAKARQEKVQEDEGTQAELPMEQEPPPPRKALAEPHKNDAPFISDQADVPTSVPIDMDVLLQVYKEARGASPEAVRQVMKKYTESADSNITDVPQKSWNRCWEDLISIVEYM